MSLSLQMHLLQLLVLSLQAMLQEPGTPASVFGSAQERELLAWVLLWWKCPAAMRTVRKVSTGCTTKFPSSDCMVEGPFKLVWPGKRMCKILGLRLCRVASHPAPEGHLGYSTHIGIVPAGPPREGPSDALKADNRMYASAASAFASAHHIGRLRRAHLVPTWQPCCNSTTRPSLGQHWLRPALMAPRTAHMPPIGARVLLALPGRLLTLRPRLQLQRQAMLQQQPPSQLLSKLMLRSRQRLLSRWQQHS